MVRKKVSGKVGLLMARKKRHYLNDLKTGLWKEWYELQAGKREGTEMVSWMALVEMVLQWSN